MLSEVSESVMGAAVVRAYGLDVQSPQGITTESEPSVSDVNQLVDENVQLGVEERRAPRPHRLPGLTHRAAERRGRPLVHATQSLRECRQLPDH